MQTEPTVLDEARLLVELAQTLGVACVSLDDLTTACSRLHALAAHPACDDATRAAADAARLVCQVFAAAHPGQQPARVAS